MLMKLWKNEYKLKKKRKEDPKIHSNLVFCVIAMDLAQTSSEG